MSTGRDRLQATGFFALRTPALPFSTLTGWSAGVASGEGRDVLCERLEAMLGRAEVRAAIRVASADLAAATERGGAGDAKARGALIRYVCRMAGRSTPFGLFAGCSTGRVAQRTELRLPAREQWTSHTRVDADHLDAVIRALAASTELRDRVTLRPNPSLLRLGGRLRYTQARLGAEERSHHLVEVADSAHLERALERAGDGARAPELIAALVDGGLEPQAAERYARELVDAQVLVGELDVTLTGPPPLDALIADLERLESGAAAALASVRDALQAVDAAGPSAPAHLHDEVSRRLAELPAPVRPQRLLQVDLVKPPSGATLGLEDVRAIARGAELLHRLTPDPAPGDLAAFREAFAERYEGREVPLLEALDDELGVGYGRPADPSPLVNGLGFTPRTVPRAPVTDRDAHLVALLHKAWSTGAHEIALSGADVEALTVPDRPPLPDALCAIATLARTAEGPRILVGGVSGPSGARLLGRFCQGDPELASAVHAHLRAEEALDPDAIFAEVVHLPTGRMANVLARPVLRDWELEWLGRSGAPPGRRLPAADLLVSLRSGRVVLRSRRLGRRVVPRLTSAHNWSRRSPGVYRFLCDVQADGRAAAAWSWGAFERAPFLPRLRRGRIVLARARWLVPADELRELGTGGFAAVRAWRERRGLPRWVVLADRDNALPVDLDNVLAVEAFGRLVRARAAATLEELFPGPEELVAEGPDGAYAHEIVLPLVSAPPPAPAAPQPAAEEVAAPLPAPNGRAPATVRRAFAPGSEWTTLKLYTGAVTAERLLRDEVAPLARRLVDAGSADAWFFLRYSDPGFHLRVRLHGDHERLRAEVAPELEALSARLLDDGRAHDAVFATYRREIERYGGAEGIEPAERLFHADSDAVADLLALFERGEAGLEERWRVGLLGADVLLRDLGVDAGARARIATRSREAFATELGAGPSVRRALGERFRAERDALADLLVADPESDHPLAPGAAVLARRSERLAPVTARLRALEQTGRLALPVEELAISFVHMWINRLMRADHRAHEYAIYDLLARLYAAGAARSRA